VIQPNELNQVRLTWEPAVYFVTLPYLTWKNCRLQNCVILICRVFLLQQLQGEVGKMDKICTVKLVCRR